MSVSHDLPRLEHVTNFRELGGLPANEGRRVRRGRLFRSGHWGRASPSDLEVLEQFGVGVVLDFRSEVDVKHEGADRLPPGTECVLLPTEDPAAQADTRTLIMNSDLAELRRHFGGGRAERYMRDSAAKLAAERTEVYGRFLAKLAESDAPPALFHCSAGKDRAGWAASVVLLALGVEQEHVVEHYLLSNVHYDVILHHGELTNAEEEVAELLRPLIRVEASYAEASIEAACKRFGSLDGYFEQGLGLSAAQLAQLRENWLEG